MNIKLLTVGVALTALAGTGLAHDALTPAQQAEATRAHWVSLVQALPYSSEDDNYKTVGEAIKAKQPDYLDLYLIPELIEMYARSAVIENLEHSTGKAIRLSGVCLSTLAKSIQTAVEIEQLDATWRHLFTDSHGNYGLVIRSKPEAPKQVYYCLGVDDFGNVRESGKF